MKSPPKTPIVTSVTLTVIHNKKAELSQRSPRIIVTQTVSYSVLEMHAAAVTFPCGLFILQSSGHREKNYLHECLWCWRWQKVECKWTSELV